MGWIRGVRVPGGALVVAAMVGGVACAPEGPPAADQQVEPPAANNVILASAMVNMPIALPASDLPAPESQGAQLVTQFCAQACHGIPAPSSHSASDWPVVLRRMWLRMGMLDSAYQVLVPSTGERAAIMEYMLANALQVSAADLPDAPGKALFAEKCSQCHGLPDVRQHSAEDWVAVVRRMNGRMEKLVGQVLSQDELQRIVLYLEATARG